MVEARQHTGTISCLDAGADGTTILTGSSDGTLAVWQLYGEKGPAAGAAPRVVHTLCAHLGPVLCAALSTQLDLALSAGEIDEAEGGGGGGGGEGRCAVWSVSNGRFVRWLAVPASPTSLCVSHSGNGLVVSCAAGGGAAGGTLCLFSINGVPLARVALGAPLGRVIATRDGSAIVASGGAAVTVRRLHDLELLHAYEIHGGAAAAAGICALSLCSENHHAFVGTEDGGFRILANPIVNIAVLEQIAGELLNL